MTYRSSESPIPLALLDIGATPPNSFVPARKREPTLDPLRALNHRYSRQDPESTPNGYASLLKNIKDRRRLPSTTSRSESLITGSVSQDSAYKYMAKRRHSDGSQSASVLRLRALSRADGEELDDDASQSDIGGSKRRGRIRVAVRKRPVDAGDEDCIEVEGPTLHINATKLRVDLSEYTESHRYNFDNAFSETHTNEDVYVQCAKPLIETVMNGGSASCFAYGQTGSGKTHTMLGTEEDHGIYLRAARDIFEARDASEHQVFVSLYEIYCNSLFDLLNSRALVIAREDANRRVNICGLTWHEIGSQDELVRLMERGAGQRRTGSTSANEYSSRSHAVLCLMVRSRTRPKFMGTLNVVDLAGSERAADTAANDKQTRLEGAEINKSLLALKECIRGLDERKKHIPFRGSKLTEVLRDSFSGNSQTVMVATISSSGANVEHTMNTLRYAFRVKGLSVDKLEPSKDRKAPPMSKRNEPTPPRVPSTLSQPLLAMQKAPSPTGAGLLKQRKKRKPYSKRRLREGGRDGDDGEDGSASPNSVKAVERQLQEVQRTVRSEIEGIREEMRNMMRSKDREIDALSSRNNSLEMKLKNLHTRLPPEFHHILLDPIGPSSPMAPSPVNSSSHPSVRDSLKGGFRLDPLAHHSPPNLATLPPGYQPETFERNSDARASRSVTTSYERDDNLF